MAARYEFRAWGEVSGPAQILRSVSRGSTTETVRDCYVLAPNPDVNAKLRDGTLDVKHLVHRRDGLEQWEPSWSEEAPFSREAVTRLFDELGHRPPAAEDSLPDVEALVGILRSRLDAAWVTKRRTHHRLDLVLAEETEVEVERTGDVLTCIALECEEPDAVISLQRRLGLDAAENLPVHLAVARSLEQ